MPTEQSRENQEVSKLPSIEGTSAFLSDEIRNIAIQERMKRKASSYERKLKEREDALDGNKEMIDRRLKILKSQIKAFKTGLKFLRPEEILKHICAIESGIKVLKEQRSVEEDYQVMLENEIKMYENELFAKKILSNNLSLFDNKKWNKQVTLWKDHYTEILKEIEEWIINRDAMRMGTLESESEFRRGGRFGECEYAKE